MAQIEKRYNRALQIAEFLIEGGRVVQDVVEEFNISKDTYRKDMMLLATMGYGKEGERNKMLYIKAKTALNNEVSSRKKMKKRE